jgi:hypothetical protein
VNSDIRYLQLLEDDLREAAQFERELDEEDRAGDARQSRGRTRPRHLPRLGRGSGIAAALVAFLVLAGGIGYLTQRGSKQASNGALGIPSASGAIAIPAGQAPDRAPVPVPPTHSTFDSVQNLPSIQRGAQSAFFGTGSGADGSVTKSISGQNVDANSGLTAAGPTGDLSKIARTGQIGILLDNGQFANGRTQVTKIAQQNKGMVLSSTSTNDQSGTFTLRIPAGHFDHVMFQLAALAPTGGVLYQNSAGKDVTASYVDYQARLGILKGERALLVGLQSKVTDAGQILYYADRINAVQLNIETIQGQLNFLNNSVSESTIDVELREKDAPGNAPDNVKNPSLRTAWHHSLQGFLGVLGAVVIGLGYLIPISVILLLIWGVIMLARRRRPATSSAP